MTDTQLLRELERERRELLADLIRENPEYDIATGEMRRRPAITWRRIERGSE